MERLLAFASSVPDFRRSDKGNIRHRLEDIIMLMVLARASGCVGRADIIEFGKHNINIPQDGHVEERCTLGSYPMPSG